MAVKRASLPAVAGVDLCHAGWFVVLMSATDGDLSYRVVYDFATVPDVERDAAIVAVDIPELCFQALNGGRAMQHPKKSAEGHAARLALLRECGFGPIADAALAALPRGVEAACQSDQSRA